MSSIRRCVFLWLSLESFSPGYTGRVPEHPAGVMHQRSEKPAISRISWAGPLLASIFL